MGDNWQPSFICKQCALRLRLQSKLATLHSVRTGSATNHSNSDNPCTAHPLRMHSLALLAVLQHVLKVAMRHAMAAVIICIISWSNR